MHKSSFIIAAPTSNSGKTTLTLGILRALKNRGKSIQPFKCGPDYIDPKFHEVACQRQGVNLDLYMMEEAHLKETYSHYANNVEVSCIEGVMGLFDGAKKSERSTAELSKTLKLPVIFVIDAKSVAYSVAPLMYGFKNFDPEIRIEGVIFNRVNTKSHYKFLQEACEDVGIPSLGYLPYLDDCKIESRHLGLSIDSIEQYDQKIEKIAESVEKTIDLEKLLELTQQSIIAEDKPIQKEGNDGLKIGIAKDEAFNFYYPQNIDALQKLGSVHFFSPLKDKVLPKVDLIYFPGGYPECFTKELSDNHEMLHQIKRYAEDEGKIIAECGGMMYLGKSLIDAKGKEHLMANVFTFSSSMQQMKLNLGYRTIELPDFPIKGHEFHYSQLINEENTTTTGKVWNARNGEVKTKIFRYKNVWASYIHLYFGEPYIIKQLIDFLKENTFTHENLHS
ncbi:cobyrinate a,c-diamide synthase [Flammeovirga pacifica]|uniref:Cobyrinate a,c-diamide synthase n=1 Tax=Flammeovirga pacifica TaxID=915059 RepID=A0A1S1YXZ5_FLAPC|nr:cobyrinate a,c-diamide synthase [Flammeovirga pacifica]OHX65860.1 cobyrinic acid a,c-diamide synthase [Flammeovirga pacifica]